MDEDIKSGCFQIALGIIVFIFLPFAGFMKYYEDFSEYFDKVKEKFETKVYFPDMEFRETKGSNNVYLYYDGKLYNGNAYAADESVVVNCKNGLPVKMTFFLPNGKSIHAEYDTDKQDFNYYDENGKWMSKSDFESKYHDFLNKAIKKIMPTKPID